MRFVAGHTFSVRYGRVPDLVAEVACMAGAALIEEIRPNLHPVVRAMAFRAQTLHVRRMGRSKSWAGKNQFRRFLARRLACFRHSDGTLIAGNLEKKVFEAITCSRRTSQRDDQGTRYRRSELTHGSSSTNPVAPGSPHQRLPTIHSTRGRSTARHSVSQGILLRGLDEHLSRRLKPSAQRL